MPKFLFKWTLLLLFVLSLFGAARIPSVFANTNRTPIQETTLYMPLIMKNYAPGPGNLSGYIYDAQNSARLANINICLYNSNMQQVQCTASATDGTYLFSNIMNGYYTIEIPSQSGYSGVQTNVIIPAYNTSIVNIPLSKVLSAGEYRIILSWNPNSIDLDANLWHPLNKMYRVTIYPGSAPEDGLPASSEDPAQFGVAGSGRQNLFIYPYAYLDLDSRDGNQSETISINMSDYIDFEGDFTYAVWNFSKAINDPTMSFTDANAKVYLYGPDGLIQIYTPPSVPPGDLDSSAYWWKVVTLHADGATPTPINQYTNECPSPYPDTETGNADTLCP